MLPIRLIGGFLLRVVVFYVLLAAPWPGLRQTYAAAYWAVGNAVFGSIASGGRVRFRAPPERDERKMDTAIIFVNVKTRASKSSLYNARFTAYLPTVETLALILATPIVWSRKWKALLWGLVLAHGLAALRVGIFLLHGFSGDDPNALYSPGPFWSQVLTQAHEMANIFISIMFVAPVFIWILVTFRRGDLEQWVTSATVPARRGGAVRKTRLRTQD